MNEAQTCDPEATDVVSTVKLTSSHFLNFFVILFLIFSLNVFQVPDPVVIFPFMYVHYKVIGKRLENTKSFTQYVSF